MRQKRQVITCKKCRVTKARDQYPRAKADGTVLYTCKLCCATKRATANKPAVSRRSIENHLDLRECKKCGVIKPMDQFPFNHKANGWRRYDCDSCCYRKTTLRSTTQDALDRVVEAYGGRCNCCGESERKFLTIDHRLNDGNVRRREQQHPPSGRQFYQWLIGRGFPSEFQLLCMNCNWGKARNKGVCPHEQPSTAIPSGSTSQAIGDGSASHPPITVGEEMVCTQWKH